jgi:hypothetical protein
VVIGCVGPYPGADPSSPYKRVTPRHRDPMIGLSVPHARVTRRDPRTCAQLRAGHYWGGRLLRCSRSQSEGPHQDSGLRVGGRSDGLEDADEAVFPGPIALLPLDAKAARTVRWTFGAQGDGTSVLGEPQPKNTKRGTTEHPRSTATSKPGQSGTADTEVSRTASQRTSIPNVRTVAGSFVDQ